MTKWFFDVQNSIICRTYNNCYAIYNKINCVHMNLLLFSLLHIVCRVDKKIKLNKWECVPSFFCIIFWILVWKSCFVLSFEKRVNSNDQKNLTNKVINFHWNWLRINQWFKMINYENKLRNFNSKYFIQQTFKLKFKLSFKSSRYVRTDRDWVNPKEFRGKKIWATE